jgi:hypothetical protein
MSSILFDLSGKIDQPTVNALSLLKRVADDLGIPFFVVGASARDILLKHCYGIDHPRSTRHCSGLSVTVFDHDFYKMALTTPHCSVYWRYVCQEKSI